MKEKVSSGIGSSAADATAATPLGPKGRGVAESHRQALEFRLQLNGQNAFNAPRGLSLR